MLLRSVQSGHRSAHWHAVHQHSRSAHCSLYPRNHFHLPQRAYWQHLQHATPDQHNIAPDLDCLNSLGSALGLHTQDARTTGETPLIQHEEFAAASQPMAKAIGTDRTRRTASRYVLHETIIVPLPHL